VRIHYPAPIILLATLKQALVDFNVVFGYLHVFYDPVTAVDFILIKGIEVR
jgi:hypothetical protein